jgi:hypothetical protein
MKTVVQIFLLCSFHLINYHMYSKDLVGMRGKLELLDSMNAYRAELGLKKVRY